MEYPSFRPEYHYEIISEEMLDRAFHNRNELAEKVFWMYHKNKSSDEELDHCRMVTSYELYGPGVIDKAFILYDDCLLGYIISTIIDIGFINIEFIPQPELKHLFIKKV